MENRKSIHKIFSAIMILFVIACFFYLSSKITYTSYESETQAHFDVEVTDLKLALNGVDVLHTASPLDSSVLTDHITWNSSHVRTGKVAPGTSGSFSIELDPTGSQVAFMFDFEFVTDNLPEGMTITYSNIHSDREIVQTDEFVYSGILTLADIDAGAKVTIFVDFLIDYDEDVEVEDFTPEQIEGLFEINFHAIQYRGEELVPYDPEG